MSVAALRCRTSDRTAGGARGAESLALALDPDARLVGTPGEPRIASFEDDLRESRGCLLEAGGQVEDMLSGVLMCGVRDLDARERVLVETARVPNARPSEVVPALKGKRVYVHLDLDVLDPDVLPSQFPVPHGLSDTGLRTLLDEVAVACDVVGVEVTAFEAPEDARDREGRTSQVASIVKALLA